MNVHESILGLIGSTPLVRLQAIEKAYGLDVRLYGKLEFQNPGGSVKDRAALAMIRAAEADGRLTAGGTIVEPTSGNTGIGLAMIAAAKGYRAVFTMPETMSKERRSLLAAFGAEVVLTDGSLGMKGAIAKAREIVASLPGAFMPSQFDNPANVAAHYQTTGPEIRADLDGAIDVFVAGVGTAGTIAGAGRDLKEHVPGIRVVAVEPDRSPVLSGGAPGKHGIQGIGPGFVAGNYDSRVVDEVRRVSDERAVAMTRELARSAGILVGVSSGAALAAAIALAKESPMNGKTIVVMMPDTGERYLSTNLFVDATI